MHETQHPTSSQPSRRGFLKRSTVATLAGCAIGSSLALERSVHAAGSDTLRIGLVGCGGRGSGAAVQALRADKQVKLTAMGDAFADRIESSLAEIQKEADVRDKIDVPPDRRFTGFDAYKSVIDSVDVVLLATPPHFRPIHLKAVVEANKHVFAEKPVAVDAPGVQSVLATCKEAAKRNLSVVSGLCLRYSNGFKETIDRIHDRAIGDVVALQANDLRGPIWVKPREPDWTDMHWQMRNWYYFTWLSGDFNVEQHVHFLDAASWVMREQYPVSAVGLGGRQVRTGPEYGNIFDHHSVIYQYADGARLYSNCRQMPGCASDMSLHVTGTAGGADISEKRLRIAGENAWTYRGIDNPIYQTEHDELFASIRSGKPINNGQYMAYSTLLAIMGRMATYTGQVVTWEQALNSKEDLSPPKYEWGPLATPSVAVPGITSLV